MMLRTLLHVPISLMMSLHVELRTIYKISSVDRMLSIVFESAQNIGESGVSKSKDSYLTTYRTTNSRS